ncbi:MAG: shikimate kinase / 3-dehydroquinate synthase [Solirubrobacteraceae bacterium]|nr:shikimate kinase / 3-dehydroquinate synthase [Solirubrobacteraceae bacterium]
MAAGAPELSPPALVFIGFMGAGKSTAARRAAAALGVEAVDCDRMLEAQLGGSIEAFFDREGEAAFREREAELTARTLAEADGGVIALGGGALGSERVRDALARHTAVLMDVPVETAWERAHDRGRPLARDRAAFEGRYAERQAVYTGAARAVLPRADALPAALGALQALADAPAGTRLLWATTAGGDYPVWVGRGLLGRLPWPVEGRRFCVSDEHVAEHYAGHIDDLAGLVEIPPGEGAKTLATAERVWRALAAMGVTRADHVVALGGGVVGDLAGFCAAGYQRGIRVVQVPTTVVAQVDSAYGGKTGVDLPEGKNYAGAYHQPAAVLADPAALRTLPQEELSAGWAEVLKTALIAGGELWRRVREGVEVDRDLVVACARTKLAVVAEDERDGGRRQVLNLGHTIGHAIETATGYRRYRHGEAVGLGLLAALTLSDRPALRAEVEGLLGDRRLPTRLDGDVDLEQVEHAVQRDKKRRGGRVGFVLVGGPGDVRVGQSVEADAVRAALQELAAP